jgi:tetratricopeptide (TPR) repeat protein
MLAVGSTSGYIQLWDLAQVSRELASVGIEVPLAPRASPAAPVAASIVAPPVVEPSRPRWIENVEGLTLALQAGPESSELHAQRAEAFLAGGQRVEAIADLGRALERKPGDAASLHLRRASLLESLGRFAEALDDLERGLEIDPGSLDLLRARAAVLDRSGREVEAVRDLERVLTASPGDAAAAEALAWILLTGPAGLRDAGRAVELARRAAADRPDLVHVQRTLGAACLRAGLIAEAREACERALTLPGGDSSPSIWLYLAMVRARTGDLDGARLALGKGQRRTADPNRRRALGPCYVRRLEELLAEARAVLEVAARPSGGP